MTFWQRFKDKLEQGEEVRYVVKNPNKPTLHKPLKKRGIGYTRKAHSRSKTQRKRAKESRKKNRRRR